MPTHHRVPFGLCRPIPITAHTTLARLRNTPSYVFADSQIKARGASFIQTPSSPPSLLPRNKICFCAHSVPVAYAELSARRLKRLPALAAYHRRTRSRAMIADFTVAANSRQLRTNNKWCSVSPLKFASPLAPALCMLRADDSRGMISHLLT